MVHQSFSMRVIDVPEKRKGNYVPGSCLTLCQATYVIQLLEELIISTSGASKNMLRPFKFR